MQLMKLKYSVSGYCTICVVKSKYVFLHDLKFISWHISAVETKANKQLSKKKKNQTQNKPLALVAKKKKKKKTAGYKHVFLLFYFWRLCLRLKRENTAEN